MLRSPLDGVVTRRLQNPGDTADPASPVVEVASDRELDLVAAVPAEAGTKVRAGQWAQLRVKGEAGRGRVLNVGQVDPQTNLLSLRIAVDNANGRLKVGAFAQASVIVSTNPRAVLIPTSAVLSREGKTLVFVAGADGKAHAREVKLGGEEGARVEVQSGVKAGEQVISSGQYALPDGAPIQPAKGSKAS